MEERYNVYFAGQLLDGHTLPAVREKLAALFKADQATLDKLFSGKVQLVKRGCDRDTALKYKQAMERAGALPVIRHAETTGADDAGPATPAAQPARPLTAAERIAALAAAPDAGRSPPSTQTPTAGVQALADGDGDIALAPPGTEVLREHERAPPVSRDIDTSALSVDVDATRLAPAAPTAAVAPDTGHFSLAEPGGLIPNLPTGSEPLSPDLSGLALSPAGTDFSDCARPAPMAPQLDLAGLAALPPGEQPDDERNRGTQPVSAPVTDHITLQD